MSTPIIPFWFKQRQCKAESVNGDRMLKLSGPNLADAFIHIEQKNSGWKAGLRLSADGTDLATVESDRPSEQAAWDTAFELYRTHFLV